MFPFTAIAVLDSDLVTALQLQSTRLWLLRRCLCDGLSCDEAIYAILTFWRCRIAAVDKGQAGGEIEMFTLWELR